MGKKFGVGIGQALWGPTIDYPPLSRSYVVVVPSYIKWLDSANRAQWEIFDIWYLH